MEAREVRHGQRFRLSNQETVYRRVTLAWPVNHELRVLGQRQILAIDTTDHVVPIQENNSVELVN